MTNRRNLLAGAALVGLSAACSAKRNPTRDQVTFLTELGATGRAGYAWVAKGKGFFDEVDLDVTVKPGPAGDANVTALSSGQVDFTTIDGTGALIRIAKGQFDKLTLIANMNTGSLISIMTLPGRSILAPPDLAGKTIIEPAGSITARLFPAYANRAGLDPTKVRWVEGSGDTIPAIVAAGSAHAAGVFVAGAPSIAAAAHRDFRDVIVMPYSRVMTDLLGNVLVTRKSLMHSNPDLVRRFTGALMKGLTYCGTHPEESAALLHQQVPSTAKDTAEQEMEILKPYISSTGRFDSMTVAKSFALLESVNLIPRVPDADGDYLRTDVL